MFQSAAVRWIYTQPMICDMSSPVAAADDEDESVVILKKIVE